MIWSEQTADSNIVSQFLPGSGSSGVNSKSSSVVIPGSIIISSKFTHIFSIVTLTGPPWGIRPFTSTTSVLKTKGSPFGPVASVKTWKRIVSKTLLVSIAIGTLFWGERLFGLIGRQHSGPQLFLKHSSDFNSHGSQSQWQWSWHPQLSLWLWHPQLSSRSLHGSQSQLSWWSLHGSHLSCFLCLNPLSILSSSNNESSKVSSTFVSLTVDTWLLLPILLLFFFVSCICCASLSEF